MKKLFFVFFLFPNLCFAACNLWSYTEPSISYYVIGPYCSQGYSGYVTENYRVDEWGGFTLDIAPIELGSDRALLNRNIFDLHLDDPYVYGITVYADLYDLCCPKRFVMTLSVYIPNPNPPPAPKLIMNWDTELYNGVESVRIMWIAYDSGGTYSTIPGSGFFEKFVGGVWVPIEGVHIDENGSVDYFKKLPCDTPLRYATFLYSWPDLIYSDSFTRADFAFVDFYSDGFPVQYNKYYYFDHYYNYQSLLYVYGLDIEVYQGSWNYFTGTEVFEKIGSTYQSIPPTEGDLSYYDVWDSPVSFLNRKFKFEIPIDSDSYSISFNVTDRCSLIGHESQGGGRKGGGSKQKVIDHRVGGAYERKINP